VIGSRKATNWLQYVEPEYFKTRHEGESPYLIIFVLTHLIQGVLLQTLAYELLSNSSLFPLAITEPMVTHPTLPLSGSGGELCSYINWTGYLYVSR